MATQPQPTIAVPASFAMRLEAAGRILRDLARELKTQQPAPVIRQRPKHIPPDQAWFWSDEWQAGEREADRALANGEYKDFDSMEKALEWLHAPQ